MAESTTAGELRAALAAYRQRNRYGKYPPELRERAIAYSCERRRAGVRVSTIASELGVKEVTAGQWTSSLETKAKGTTKSIPSGPGLSLMPVVVRAEPSMTRLTRLEVEFPDGTRLAASGIVGRDLVDAIESLRRMR